MLRNNPGAVEQADMLISASRKLLFVHIQKTGGESVAQMLARGAADIRRYGAKHEFARAGKERLGAAWNEYFKFAFARNPWDRLVSWYTMIEHAKQISWSNTLLDRRKRNHRRSRHNNPLLRFVFRNCSNFTDFVTNCGDEDE